MEGSDHRSDRSDNAKRPRTRVLGAANEKSVSCDSTGVGSKGEHYEPALKSGLGSTFARLAGLAGILPETRVRGLKERMVGAEGRKSGAHQSSSRKEAADVDAGDSDQHRTTMDGRAAAASSSSRSSRVGWSLHKSRPRSPSRRCRRGSSS